MLHKVEMVEEGAPVETGTTSDQREENGVSGEMPTQRQTVSVKDLARSVNIGITRNKRRTRILQRINQLYGLIWACVWCWDLQHGGAHFVWLLSLSLLSSFLRRLTFDAVLENWARKSRSEERNAAKQLMESDDPEAVAPLIDLLHWTREKSLRPGLWEAFARLSPQLSTNQAQELGKERHGILAGWTKSWDRQSADYHAPLPGILHTLGAVGKRALRTKTRFGDSLTVSLPPLLKGWAAGEGAGQDEQVQQAAITCQEALANETALSHSGKQLLRASSAPVAGVEDLLIPAQGALPTPAEELLRPGSPEEWKAKPGKGREE